ncbi:YhdP family protein [Yoonia litorea]|uniref:AsmA-like C-terminal region n=1 Tax=Yoonia litorea TaxID=1123755 RepID=A0A1I6MBZ5_9RHOB|nr:AsmA-like C-terminal region-containing protein [Yoonia litorea]SFS13098.1 Protein of unknown function [Yoonia litorea]
MADETDDEPRKPAPKRKVMPAWVFWLRAVFVVSLLPLAFLAAAAVMVIDREITAPSWIAERVEERVEEILPGAALDFGRITVRIGRDLHPTVRLVDTKLVDADGLTLTRVPVVEGLISPRGLILQRQLLPQEVRLLGAQVNLRRARDGRVSFAFETGASDVAEGRNLPELLEQFDAVFEIPALAALERVTTEGVIINFDDARAGRSWIIDGGRLSLDLRDGQTRLRGDFALLAGRPDVTTVSLSYTSTRGSAAAQIGLNLDNAVASDLATQSPALTWLEGIDAPISADMRTVLDEDGALGPLNARLEIGAGAFQPNPGTPPVRFENAQAYFSFDPVRDLISFSEMNVTSDWGRLRGDGTAYLRAFEDGLPDAILAQLRLTDVVINPPGFYETAPALPALAVDFRARFNPFVLDIGQITARDADSRLVADGRIAATDAGWDIALDAEMDEVTPERMVAFWPPAMKPRSRDWFAKNVSGGIFEDIVFGFRRAPERETQFAVGFAFEDTAIKFLRHIPPIRGADGVASIEDSRFVISLEDGRVLAPQGGPLSLAGSHMIIEDMRLNPSPATLDLTIDSSLTAALSILNQKPFEYMDKANLPVTVAQGRALTEGQIRWPLMPRPDPADITVAMTSELTSVRSERLLPGRTFVAPRLQVTASRQGVNIAGPVQVGDVSAIGAWDQRFGDPDLPGSRVLANVALSQDFLDEFGIALPPGTIAGRGRGELAVQFGQGTPSFSLTSDLAGLTVGIPAVGWSKGPQTTGNLVIEGRLGPVPEVTRLEIGGGGLQASGAIALDPQGQLDVARFDRVRVGNWLDAPITLQGRGAGQPVGVNILGGAIDLRAARFGAGGGDSGPINIRLDRLQVTEGIALRNFAGAFRSEGGFRGDFTAEVNGAAQVAGAVAPRDGRSAVRVRSADAGDLLRATGLADTVVGGAFDLTLLPSAGAGEFDGFVTVDDIRVRDAPTIAALLDAISVVGLLQQLDGQGLAFDSVEARFRLTPTEVIIAEASAVGPGLGISLDGIYTLASKRIDLQGVVSPFYLVNGLGAFLTRRGEGLIGFNYTIGGTADAPVVGVNPLSALTPGMFREIFRRPAPELSQ